MIPTKPKNQDGEVFALSVRIGQLENQLAEAKAQVAAAKKLIENAKKLIEKWDKKQSPYNANTEGGKLLAEGFIFGRKDCGAELLTVLESEGKVAHEQA